MHISSFDLGRWLWKKSPKERSYVMVLLIEQVEVSSTLAQKQIIPEYYNVTPIYNFYFATDAYWH